MADQHQKTSSEDEKINNIVIKLTVPGQKIFDVCKYLVLIPNAYLQIEPILNCKLNCPPRNL